MIDKLELVLALARERHFGRAAEACGVSQPTLSAGLKSLEDALGVLIIRRNSRFRDFTPEGMRILEWARRIVGDADAMRREIKALRSGIEGELRLAVIPMASRLVVRLTAPIQAAHPGVRVSIRQRGHSEIIRMIEDVEADAGISYLDEVRPGRILALPLMDERYELLTHREGKLGRRQQVSWNELADMPLCLLTPEMQDRRPIAEFLGLPPCRALAAVESDSIGVLVAHVDAGHLSSILPHASVDGLHLPNAIASIPIMQPDVKRPVGLVMPRRAMGWPIAARLAAEARRMVRGGGARNVVRGIVAARPAVEPVG